MAARIQEIVYWMVKMRDYSSMADEKESAPAPRAHLRDTALGLFATACLLGAFDMPVYVWRNHQAWSLETLLMLLMRFTIGSVIVFTYKRQLARQFSRG